MDRFASDPRRRRILVLAVGSLFAAGGGRTGARGNGASASDVDSPDSRFYAAALSMKRMAESWGDQPYGAVLVFGGLVIGEGPSRVVKLGDASAHAEREAIRDAQRKLGRDSLAGSLLYSTSRPCRLCEAAAAKAGVARMIFGADLTDAGRPKL